MELLERYLQAVGQYLPVRTKADTLAELRANLMAQMEGREEELGRGLTQAEVASVLEKHGRPVLVAARYLPQQYLIGPAWFPICSLVRAEEELPLCRGGVCCGERSDAGGGGVRSGSERPLRYRCSYPGHFPAASL